MRSALYMARTLGLQLLKVFSDNSTLIRAISGNSQSKEITGIVFDIRSISSDFATIVFYISRSENVIAENLAKQALRAFSSLYWTLGLGLGHRFGPLFFYLMKVLCDKKKVDFDDEPL